METKRYGLFTAVAMIIGTVIGSGIFFKSDDILYYTQGNAWLGVAVLSISAIAIVFGCLTLNKLSERSKSTGGIVAYASQYYNRRTASAFGWFFVFVYFPTLAVVISWVVGIYSCIFFGFPQTQFFQIGIGFLYLLICCLYNLVSPVFAGFFQRASTLIKLVPLFLIAILGLVLGKGVAPGNLVNPAVTPSISWLAAIGPIAFSFDGWVVVLSIASELKNPRRHMGLALIISPIFVLMIYVAYFLGITKLMGVDTILGLGDAHVNLAASTLFGTIGAKFLMLGVLLSVMGTLNGVVMAGIRVPHTMALDGMIPWHRKLRVVNDRLKMPLYSGLLFLILSVIWYVLHTLTLIYGFLPHSDVSEIAIVVQYLLYVPLYAQVIRLYQKGEIKGAGSGLAFPFLAIAGSIIIVLGGLQNPLAPFYALFCFLVMAAGYIYTVKSDEN